jgi:hypothetical protein
MARNRRLVDEHPAHGYRRYAARVEGARGVSVED